MQYAADVELPELKCAVCGKPLQLLMQYVSQKSSDALHRVIYVFICNSKHYKESVRVLTYNKNIALEEQDTEPTAPQASAPQTSATSAAFDEDIDLGALMDAVQTMGQAPKEPVPQKATAKPTSPYPAQLQALFDECRTRDVPGAYTAYDVRTEPGEALIREFASGNIETITDAAKTLYTDGLQQQTRGALFIAGYGRRALCHQTCVEKMKKGLFEEDKYKVVVVASEGEDDPDRPMESTQKYKLAKNFQEGVCDVQLGAEEEAQI